MSRSGIWVCIVTVVLCFAISTFAQQSDSLSSSDSLPPSPCVSITSDGTAKANQVTKFTSNCNIEGSKITDNGSTASIGELLTLPSKGTATATAGKNSQAENWTTSVFNSGTATAVPQNFRLQAEPASNNTPTATGTLNLLFGQGTAAPAETGFFFFKNGRIHFAAGQTFPGTGTVSSVGSGAGLTGGPITTTGTISIANGGVTNAMLHNSSITVNAGTDLTGGGVVPLGGSTTINLDTSRISVGYSATVPVGANPALAAPFPGTLIMQTNAVATSGVYFISAGVLPFVANGDSSVFCYDNLTSLGAGNPSQWGGSFQSGNYAQVSITDALFINAGDSVQVYCECGGTSGASFVFNAGLTATLINSANGAQKAKRLQRLQPRRLPSDPSLIRPHKQ